MARLLISKKLMHAFAIAAVICILLLGVQSVDATNYNGWMTGYAFGNSTGSSGYPVVQRDFANHLPAYCPGDPASYWLWNSTIYVASPIIYLSNSSGTYYRVTAFYLTDGGDLNCSQGNYWADIYFGRYTPTPSNCSCPGSPYGYCISGVRNNCQDAINFGRSWSTYSH